MCKTCNKRHTRAGLEKNEEKVIAFPDELTLLDSIIFTSEQLSCPVERQEFLESVYLKLGEIVKVGVK